ADAPSREAVDQLGVWRFTLTRPSATLSQGRGPEKSSPLPWERVAEGRVRVKRQTPSHAQVFAPAVTVSLGCSRARRRLRRQRLRLRPPARAAILPRPPKPGREAAPMDPAEYLKLERLDRDHWFYRGKKAIVRHWIGRYLDLKPDDLLVDGGTGTGLWP